MGLLRAKNIEKSFGAVRALKGVSFNLGKARGLALVGENGAGKSTLMKVISGVYPCGTFKGSFSFDGKECEFDGTKEAEELGLSIVHQELNLFPELTVAENIFLSHLPKKGLGQVDDQKMAADTQVLLDQLGVPFKPKDRVGDLSNGHQQMVEIAKALSQNAKILILDEPTSSLTQKEVDYLFKVVKKLQEGGLSFIYISHKLEEVYELCQDCVVLRDGESVWEGELINISTLELISHMVGRELTNLYPDKKVIGESSYERVPFFEVKDWKTTKISEKKVKCEGISFQAYPGEILGLSGMMGAGRTDLFLSLFGHEDYTREGEIFINGRKKEVASPRDALKNGMALVTEDRKTTGLHLEFSIEDNISMASWQGLKKGQVIDRDKVNEIVKKFVKKLNIKISDPSLPVKTLSGGNQQKVAIAKWLATNPQVIFLDEPTRGIDVGAKFEIYSLLNQLVDLGMCVIVASSELPEVIGLCNRVMVLYEGKLVETVHGERVNETEIMKAALGGL